MQKIKETTDKHLVFVADSDGINTELHLFFGVGIDNSFQCFLSVGTFVAGQKTSWKTFGQDIQFFFEDKPIIVGNIEQR